MRRISSRMFLFSTLMLFIAGIGQINSFNPVYDEFLNAFQLEKSRVMARINPNIIHKFVGPPDRKSEITEMDVGDGRHKLVVTRDGKKREYTIHREIWREYMDIGGEESVLGSPTSNQYTWCNGTRQDFERGHWLYWSEETGVQMDFTPFGKWQGSAESTLQVPIFYKGKPAVEWASWSNEKYFITQDFGVNGHLGQDLAANGNPDPGCEIRPVTEGKVLLSGWTGSDTWGYMVLIQHSLKNGRHYYSQYAHLSDLPKVLPGNQVNKGTVLGYVGNTGKSSGPHLDIQLKELPEVDLNRDVIIGIKDIGTGYTENHSTFNSNIIVDSQSRIVYYKPSYFINSFNNGSVLVGLSPGKGKEF